MDVFDLITGIASAPFKVGGAVIDMLFDQSSLYDVDISDEEASERGLYDSLSNGAKMPKKYKDGKTPIGKQVW